MSWIFFSSIFLLFYAYFGFLLTLWIVSVFYRTRPKTTYKETEHGFSIIIAAHNEEKSIKKRIKNLLDLEYGTFEILVASDGSTDETVTRALHIEDPKLRILDFKENEGRALTHNKSLSESKHEIIVFTDAETKFAPNFLTELNKTFQNPNVSCVSGKLSFITNEEAISKSEGLYWKFEVMLRRLENSLGIFCSGTGACIAVRKSDYINMTPKEDIDDSAPIYCIARGKTIVFAENVLAWDYANDNAEIEIKARARMTSKGILGLKRHWSIKRLITNPIYSWVIVSHKVLRWNTMPLLITALISNIWLFSFKGDSIYQWLLFLQGLFYFSFFLGFLGNRLRFKTPLTSTVFSFLVASYGMFLGVIKGMTDKTPAEY